ncbi:DHS-like NAD/FAD-binding domain-containing protein [Lepidopterella palustris CBS 459.81]|uniref:DHS-like NAD/FAD-binding domain-containing protein n=1 Tax=Lepidopterella palustris CBS 459.81 TaxID=1314670 RepID=A0A8E2J9J7_9PEZI|nr:DHS-like NAD/FAD-binding domain-containing protein [Lepidopterella palustris CBS 459.81]
MLERASKATPTRFHHFLDKLAQSGRLHRHYTQNIDCLESKLPWLSHKTLQLHGRLDTLVCQKRSTHSVQITPEDFEQRVISQCLECVEADKARVEKGKRSHGVGVLLPKVLLYGAVPDESVIGDMAEGDLLQMVDAVIIAGTRLQIRPVKCLAEELCRAVKRAEGGGLSVWVNKEGPKLGPKLDSLLDYKFLGDCDEFASLVSA